MIFRVVALGRNTPVGSQWRWNRSETREREEVDEESQGTRQDPHRMANQPKKKRDPKTVPKKNKKFFFFLLLLRSWQSKRRMIERFRRACVCVCPGVVGKRRRRKKRRTSKRGEKAERERNGEREGGSATGLQLVETVALGRLRRELWCAGRAGFPFLGLGLLFGYETVRVSFTHARTEQCVEEENCARYATSFSPFLYTPPVTRRRRRVVVSTGVVANTHSRRRETTTTRRENRNFLPSTSAQKIAQPRASTPRWMLPLLLVWLQKLPRHKKFSFSISPTPLFCFSSSHYKRINRLLSPPFFSPLPFRLVCLPGYILSPLLFFLEGPKLSCVYWPIRRI